MKESNYIRIYKKVQTYRTRHYVIDTVWDHYEFYFTSIANCAR